MAKNELMISFETIPVTNIVLIVVVLVFMHAFFAPHGFSRRLLLGLWNTVVYLYQKIAPRKKVTIPYENWLPIITDKSAPLELRINLLKKYVRSYHTMADDLLYVAYYMEDYEFEKNPEVRKMIEYAHNQVQRHRPNMEESDYVRLFTKTTAKEVKR
jgi:sulfur relay (sulfurtransferase) DsrC/TusE family protein